MRTGRSPTVTISSPAEAAQAPESLLGLEGNVARHYFGRFAAMLKPREFDADWDFDARNRRPPKDPVNAMSSFVSALVAKECTVALLAEGLDPCRGLWLRDKGWPALSRSTERGPIEAH